MNKQSMEYKIIKKWLLIGVIIVITILIFYFTLTNAPDSVNVTSQNKKPTNISYNLWALLLTLTGIVLLPLSYLAATKKLNEIYGTLINNYKSFKSHIKSPEEEKGLAITLVVVAVLILFFSGQYLNCCGWWATLSAKLSAELYPRLSSPKEPLNLRNILIGIAGVATLIFAGWRTHIANQTRILDKGRRFDERFDNAAKALSKELNESSFPAHLGAISSLRALAVDSSEDTQRCLDIICSCNQWMEEGGYIDRFIEKRSRNPYSSWLLNEDNRIANKSRGGEVTLLHEKRSQKALVAISHVLENISTNNSVQLSELDFHNKMLCGISLKDIILDGINFNSTYLTGAVLNNISLNKAKLSRTNLQGINLAEANLQGVNLLGANLQGVELQFANLQGASLNATNLQGAYLLGANLQGSYLQHANLQGANLQGANLEGASLRHANLQNAYLENANIQGAFLIWANLQGVFLSNARLQGATLSYADLREALIINSQLQGATLYNADLSHAILSNCNLYGAALKDIKSKNIMFNDVVDIGYIKEKEKREKYLDDICLHMEPINLQLLKQKIEAAWQAMENNQEPDGLDIIRKNSIITKDNKGVYNISKKHLDGLQKRLQKKVNKKDIHSLRNIRISIGSLYQPPRGYIDGSHELLNEDTSTNKYVNLRRKLQELIDQLAKSKKPQKGK